METEAANELKALLEERQKERDISLSEAATKLRGFSVLATYRSVYDIMDLLKSGNKEELEHTVNILCDLLRMHVDITFSQQFALRAIDELQFRTRTSNLRSFFPVSSGLLREEDEVDLRETIQDQVDKLCLTILYLAERQNKGSSLFIPPELGFDIGDISAFSFLAKTLVAYRMDTVSGNNALDLSTDDIVSVLSTHGKFLIVKDRHGNIGFAPWDILDFCAYGFGLSR